MAPTPPKRSNRFLKKLGRVLLRRLEAPRKSYEKRIVNNLDSLYGVIRKGDVLLVEGRSEMSRIIPRDFDVESIPRVEVFPDRRGLATALSSYVAKAAQASSSACGRFSVALSGGSLIEKAWKHLEDAVVYYQGRPVGTIAALDPGPTALFKERSFTASNACGKDEKRWNRKKTINGSARQPWSG